MQFINFLILVWLMKRFLYKPILKAIDAREEYISSQLKDAEKDKVKANHELEQIQGLKKDIENKQQELINQAIADAEATHRKLLDDARKDAESLRLQFQETLINEQEKLSSEITRRTQNEVFAIARKTLADLANVSLEAQMVHIFIDRIKNMASEAKKTLQKAISNSNGQIFLRTSFDLENNLQQSIKETIADNISDKIELKFETAPHLISGIALITEGYMVVWSISDYLASLEASITGLLKEYRGKSII
jgi:F-type H+-transporting ATPase subunit b